MSLDFGDGPRHSMGGSDYLSGRSSGTGGGNVPTSRASSSAGKGAMSPALPAIYSYPFPSVHELRVSLTPDAASVEEMKEVVLELRRQVDLLSEETDVLVKFSDSLRRLQSGSGSQGYSNSGDGGIGEDNTGPLMPSDPHRAERPVIDGGLKRGTDGGEEHYDGGDGEGWVDSHGGSDDRGAGSGSTSGRDAHRSNRNKEGSRRGYPSRGNTSHSHINSHSRQPRGAAPEGAGPGVYGPSHNAEGSGAEVMLTEDKLMLMNKEMERLHQQEEKGGKESEEIKELLVATVEEASKRMKELRLEVLRFNREVIDEENGNASGNLLTLYMERRGTTQKGYLDKLLGQCQAVEEDIARAQQQLRARRAAGEAFHAIDFEQLRIENQQFNERIDKKNQELVELKGTSTRTVQTLNTLMDALNDMTSEQGQLKKEFKSRCDYLARCAKEVGVVMKEAEKAELKHHALRSQHEAVKVPKIEEYIAQKAELFELEKACKNWQRKVEIAEGQRQVLRQQLERLRRQRNAAIEYNNNKKKRLLENLGKCPTKLPIIGGPPKPPPGVTLPPGYQPVEANTTVAASVLGAERETGKERKGSSVPVSAPAAASPSSGESPKKEKPMNPTEGAEGSATSSRPSPPQVYEFPTAEET